MYASICYFYSVFPPLFVNYLASFEYQIKKIPYVANSSRHNFSCSNCYGNYKHKSPEAGSKESSLPRTCSTSYSADGWIIPNHLVVISGSVIPADQTGSLHRY